MFQIIDYLRIPLPSLHGGSLEIALTVPLISGQTICLGSTNARGYLL